MHVLLMGGEGYIGGVLGPFLLEAGHHVTVYDAGFYRDGRFGAPPGAAPRWKRLDSRQVQAADLEGFDAVVHMADLSNDGVGEFDPELTFRINHQAVARLAELARAAGVERFVYSSSCSVYGASGGNGAGLSTEQSPTGPLTTYSRCKLLVEDVLRRLAGPGFTPVILRNATAYGVSPRMRLDLVVNELTAMAYLGRRLVLASDGSPWRPFVHVRDICRAVQCALDAPAVEVRGEVYNVGDTSANHQVRDICRIIGEEIDGCEVVMGESGGDRRNYRVDFTKINTRLPGFECGHDLRQGVVELRDALERMHFTEDMLRFRAYRRLAQIRYLVETRRLDAELFWRR